MMEYSGRVRDAFTKRGHHAVSCDLEETETPGEHSRLHWYEFLDRYPKWDLMIAHPPCTYLALSGSKWFYHPDDKELMPELRRPHPKYLNRIEDRQKALLVVETLWKQKLIPKVVIENPIGRIPTFSPRIMGKSTQIIQPWQFGDPEKKATCLWERGVEKLIPIYETPEEFLYFSEFNELKSSVHEAAPGLLRWKERSRTFRGIANAFADQWG